MGEYQDIWKTALGEIELNISKANFITWFKNTSLVSISEGTAVIIVPNTFTKEWLEKKYNKLLLGTLRNINYEIKKIDLQIGGQQNATKPIKPKSKVTIYTAPKINNNFYQPDFPELQIDKETNLNSRYTLSSFIRGTFNEMAYMASLAICDKPGMVYNPLFVYGGVGLGKTHLIQAVGNEIKKRYKNKSVYYISADKFSSDFVNAIRNNTVDGFKEEYKNKDVLIMDDIQFIAGREKSQEEFFHIFNSLYEKNKQIIISSDRPPKVLSLIEDRLKSRFSGGLLADISLPDFETRAAILKLKSQEKECNLPPEIVSYIATNIKDNIRELEGALNTVIGFYKMNNKFPDSNDLVKILSNIINPVKRITNYKQIIDVVARYYNINYNDLLHKNRRKEIIKPRQIVMYLMREDLKISYPSIGEKLGGRDHTTVMYACGKIEEEIKENRDLIKELEVIRESVYKLVNN